MSMCVRGYHCVCGRIVNECVSVGVYECVCIYVKVCMFE